MFMERIERFAGIEQDLAETESGARLGCAIEASSPGS